MLNLTQQAFRYELAPTAAQEAFLASCVGAPRFWFNQGLVLVKARLEEQSFGHDVTVPWSYKSLCSEIEKERRAALAPWQGEVVCGCYQAGFEALGKALQNFSAGKRSGRKVGFPRFRRKGACTESVIFQRPRILDSRQAEGLQCHVAAAGAETGNARGGHVSPAPWSRQRPLKREDLVTRSSRRRKTPLSPRDNHGNRRQEPSPAP